MIILKSILIIIANLIIYTLLGSLVFYKREDRANLGLYIISGFFLYYIIFFIVCFPFMIKYRPLDLFIKCFCLIMSAILITALFLNFRKLKNAVTGLMKYIKGHPYGTLLLVIVIGVQVFLVTAVYNFTLDAAYYVSNVSTSLETNMINVYDPFTGAWQDHYEVRYLFATYSINDALICYLTKIPALVQTKLVMSATVIILVNILYIMTAFYLFKNLNKTIIMVYLMFVVNCTFNTIFTSSVFLLTRTYEGKTVVGNLSLLAIFYVFMRMINDEEPSRPWLMIFLASLGSMTISSSANMLIPAELTLLFLPYMFIKKTLKPILNYIACMLPGIVIAIIYILYIKGYFVFYTYPR